jgi:hypothetical protein
MLRILTLVVLFKALFQFQGSTPPTKPFTLQQVWSLNSTYADQKHGITFRYPSVWKAGTGFGYLPPALTSLESDQPVKGFIYEEGGFNPGGFNPRPEISGPYAGTNLEGVGVVYSVFPAAKEDACETKAASLAAQAVNPLQEKTGEVKIADRAYSIYGTQLAAASQSISGKLYETYAGGTCYLFETDFEVSAAGLGDGRRQLTPEEKRDIDTHLLNIMQTVRILMQASH